MNIYFIASEDHKVFGIGQTTRSFEERHKDGDWSKFHNYLAARGEELKLIHWWEDVGVVDHDIHHFLKKQPGIRKYAEWFSHKSTLAIIKQRIIHEFFSGYRDEKVELKLKPYQREFVAKAQADYLEFLLAAKCRAGKSVMVLSHIVDKGHKVSLVVSRFTSPSQSWLQDTEKFDKFNNLVTVNLKDKDWATQLEFWHNTDKQIVIWSTVQGLTRKLPKLTSTVGVDLLVFDEAHVGDSAKQFIALREALCDTPCLKVSGTAYDQLWDTTEDNRFIYDYWQEQLDVQRGIIDRPKMNLYLVKYESDKYTALYGDDPDSMSNLFLVKDGKFVDVALVRDFITQYFDNKKTVKPKDRLLRNSEHIYMTLPSVEACHLFAELIDPVIPALVVTGDTGVTSEDINQFVNEHTQSICLTYSANVLGTTQAKWDTVINCREGKSIQFWTQFAFRAGSGNHDWQVIDFVPSRALVSLRETFCLANDLDPQLSEYEFTDFVPIHEWSGGFERLSSDRVNDILAADIGSVAQLMSGATKDIDLNELNDFDFAEYRNFSKEITKEVVVNEETDNGASAKKLVSDKQQGEKTELQQKIQTIKSVLSLVPQVILEERMKGVSVSTIHDVISTETYPAFTGDTHLLLELINSGVLSSQSLSRRVTQTSRAIDKAIANNMVDEAYDSLQHVTGIQRAIPTDLFSAMIEL